MSNAPDFLQEKLPYDAYRHHPAPGWALRGLKIFQMRLTMLAGKNPIGEPRLRIKWGPDITFYWGGRQVPKYVVAKAQILEKVSKVTGLLVPRDIWYAYPHFFIEQWRAPEFMTQPGIDPERDWKKPIINRDPMGNVLELNLPDNLESTRRIEDKIGEFPRAGRYDYFYRINPAFREPTDHDFAGIQKRWKEAVAMMFRDPATIEAEEASARASRDAALAEKYADAYGRDLLANWDVISRGAAGRKATVILPHDRTDQEAG